MSARRAAGLVAALIAVSAPVAAAEPGIDRRWASPVAVPAAGPEATVVLVRTTSGATAVRLDWAGDAPDLEFSRLAPDVFGALVYGPQLLGDRRNLETGHRVAGRLIARDGSGTESPGNIFDVNVDDPAHVPGVPVRTIAPDARCAPHVVNVRLPGDPWASYEFADQPALQRAYALLGGDDYDFANVVFALPETRANRSHYAVRNSVSGIGKPIHDDGGATGSAGRLRGITNYPLSTYYDLAESSSSHETGHQWINFLGRTGGADALLGTGGSHWPPSDLARGIMGFSLPDGAGGDFPYKLTPVGGGRYRVDAAPVLGEFTSLDLYLMGLLPASQVEPFVVVNDTAADRGVFSGNPVGQEVGGTTLTVNDVIAAQGPRSPAAASPQTFRVLTVVVTRGELLDDRELAFLDHMTARGEATQVVRTSIGYAVTDDKPFAPATRGLAKLDTAVTCPAQAGAAPELTGLFRGLDQTVLASTVGAGAVRNELRAKLLPAQYAWTAGDAAGAKARMDEWVAIVNARRGGAIAPATADALLAIESSLFAGLTSFPVAAPVDPGTTAPPIGPPAVTQPPTVQPPAAVRGVQLLHRGRVRARGGKLRLRVRCLSPTACRARLVLRAGDRRVAGKRFTVAPRATKRVTVRMQRKVKRVRVVLTASDAAGALKTVRRTLRVRP